MDLEIKELKKADYKKIVDFASVGMNFNWYVKSKFSLYLYLKYFWYRELNRTTEIIAAYNQDEIVGAMLLSFKDDKTKYHSLFKSIYVKLFDLLNVEDDYDKANQEMFDSYSKDNKLDGEITFFTVNPKYNGKGIGTLLLSELEKRKRGKTVYAYTDNGCNYHFYEHRGFIKAGEKEILTTINGKKAPLECFLYVKKL